MRFDMIEHLVSNLPITHDRIVKDKSSVDNTFQELLDYLRNVNDVREKNTDEVSNGDLLDKLNNLKKTIEHLFEYGEIFSAKNAFNDKIGKEVLNTNDIINSKRMINETTKESIREIYSLINRFIDNFSNEDRIKSDAINQVEYFLDKPATSKNKSTVPHSLEELARGKKFLLEKNGLINDYPNLVSRGEIKENINYINRETEEENINSKIEVLINRGTEKENFNSKIEALINEISSVVRNQKDTLIASNIHNRFIDRDVLSMIESLTSNINANESDKLKKVINTLEKFINKLENVNYENEVAKLLNDKLIAKYTGEGGEMGKLNFINTNKGDKLFREIFFKNNKQKDAKEATLKEANHIDTSRAHKRLFADHNFNKQNIEKTSINSDKGGRTEQLLTKEIQVNNNDNPHIKAQQMHFGSNLTDKNVFEIKGDQLSSPRLIKDIANKIVEYVKFVKESNHSKAELRIAMDDIGKVKILFTDNNDSIKAKIFLDNDNLKHLISTAFESIKGNLVQKGVNISEYNFFNFSREHNNKREHEEDKSGRKFANKKIEKIEEGETKLNGLYA